MKKVIVLVAEENKVFDWKEPHYITVIDPDTGEETQEEDHLYTKKLYISILDSMDNYIEVDEPISESEEE